MDKILFIDAHNAIHRANIGFGATKSKAHGPCLDCDAYITMHHQDRIHCYCGGDWEDDKCSEEPKDDFVTIFNFFRNLRPIIELFSPDKCFFVLEGHPQFRYDLFADYKANRLVKQGIKQESKDKFLAAKDEIVRLIQYLPITICRASNYEADDVISTLCTNLNNEDLTIVSNDSDYIQLLQCNYPKLQIYNPIKKIFMDAPDYPYVVWKCLVGDPSDNIKGFPGIGTKKAQAMLNNPELLKKFLLIEENRANFSINRKLIEFSSVPAEEIVIQEGIKNFSKLKEEFFFMKFESIINDNSWKKYCDTFNCLKY